MTMLKENISSTNNRFFIANHLDLTIAITQTLSWQPLLGASAVDKSFIATIVSELASNIIKYAKSGYIELRSYERPGNVEIDVVAIDNGPGIVNVKQAMQEHFSSGGTLGLGLSGVKRIADDFEIYSTVGYGTCVFARKKIKINAVQQVLSLTTASYCSNSERLAAFRDASLVEPASTINFEIGKCIRAYPGQIVSGDQVLALPLEDGYFLAIIDATGHGPDAHKMALVLLAAVKKIASRNLVDIMSKLYELAKGTIGAAIGLAFFDANKQTVYCAGIGNTSLVVFNDKKWRGVSRDGILGQRSPSFMEQSTPFNPGDMAIMFTDGLSESLANNEAIKLRFQDANTIAYRLVDVLGKTYDDASCIVLKWNK
ncbi:SpoIIE family protein phosphatase [Methylobacter sp. S3L5C]|uniref:SpoIIE family protein phosphatase n=1 Tax=Methylobacter sp. S3L5C TaxID=2839024 RepID=UPI001FAC9C8D|nr:SpoIIE family protein phosphatase [Methylobacter sp. S3L5C]UOA06967.1 SpoIIE family protein phosphatase [Methylobacter sp. S3L5C]